MAVSPGSDAEASPYFLYEIYPKIYPKFVDVYALKKNLQVMTIVRGALLL